MAGGSGTRFWPLSRSAYPKQLLNLTGNGPMLNEAILRLRHVADQKSIYVISNCKQATQTRQTVQGLIEPSHLLLEPASRNTAACIGYAAVHILKTKGDGVMVVTPADHYIADVPALVSLLDLGIHAAQDEDKLVTIGFTPTFPATGYGYIRFDASHGGAVKPVLEFKEKPDQQTAQAFVSQGTYVWNSGMFVWKASVILHKLKEHAPAVYEALLRMYDAMGTSDEQAALEACYADIPSISIDYAVMEPAAQNGDVLVIPGACGWSDVGSWDMMPVLHDADSAGNVRIGDVLAINTHGCIAYSTGRPIALVDVDDIVVVETDDVVMVCRKDSAQDVKLLADSIAESSRNDLL